MQYSMAVKSKILSLVITDVRLYGTFYLFIFFFKNNKLRSVDLNLNSHNEKNIYFFTVNSF